MSEASLPRLSYAELSVVPSRFRPAVDPASRAVRIVHLGIGAFHRAHQAYYTERCGDWAICGVTQRSGDVVEQLVPQDGLYTLVERGSDRTSLSIIGAVRQVMFAGADPDAVVRRIADPDVSIVTTTVTEKGYLHDPVRQVLRLDDPEIVADLAGRPPRTVVGQISAAVAARAARSASPLTVLCCDNLPSNGVLLGGLVRTFLEHSGYPAGVRDWLEEFVAFPSSVVDRITPATTTADRRLVAAELGVIDHGTVVAEPFTQWVIERRFAGARPAWEDAGALLVDDVYPYEQLKLRLLNGSHSALAYLGGLAGYETIADAMADVDLASFVRSFMRDDVVPTLSVPPGLDVAEYQASVLGRFANPALGHRTSQVAMDGSHKLPQRLLGTIRDRRRLGAEPILATLVVAAWMRHIATGIDDDGRPFEPDDPSLDMLRVHLDNAGPATSGIVDGLLAVEEIFGELGDDRWFRGTLLRLLGDLGSHRVKHVVRSLVAPAATVPTDLVDGVGR